MQNLLVLCTIGLAVGASAHKFDFDTTIDIYDVFNTAEVGVPLGYYVDRISKDGEVRFTDDYKFLFYPDNITDFVVAFKREGEEFFKSYYIRAKDFTEEQFKVVKPLYDYLTSGEFYILTPMAVRKVIPEFFKTPIKKFYYEYYSDADMKKITPFVYLVPKSFLSGAKLEDLLLLAQYKITKDGAHEVTGYRPVRAIREVFDMEDKKEIKKEEVYGEPKEVITKVAKPVALTSPEGFRLINTYRYELPAYSYYNTYPYEYFFKRAYGSYPYYYSGLPLHYAKREVPHIPEHPEHPESY